MDCPQRGFSQVKAIQRRNQLELEAGSTGASWHDEFKDSAYVYVGGLDNDLTEGDVITIMSQYGEVADVNLPRNKQTGKTQGFAFLMYEDQRSTVLAVDNLNGSQVLGRTLRVDHVKNYKQMEKGEDGKMKERDTQSLNALPENFVYHKGDASGSDSPDPDLDPDDPMSAYILEQKRERKRRRIQKYGNESKEERRARKERKRAKKLGKDSERGEIDLHQKSGSERHERHPDFDSPSGYRDDRTDDRRRDRPDDLRFERDDRQDDRQRRDNRHDDRYRKDDRDDYRYRRDERDNDRYRRDDPPRSRDGGYRREELDDDR